MIGDFWIKALEEQKKVAASAGISAEFQWLQIELGDNNIDLKPFIKSDYKNVLVFSLYSDLFKYAPLEKADDPTFVMPPSYQVLMPNPKFDFEDFSKKILDLKTHCLEHNPGLTFILVLPPRIDLYEFNLLTIAAFPKFYQNLFHSNEKYSKEKLSEYSLTAHYAGNKLAAMSDVWPSKSVFRTHLLLSKNKSYRGIVAKYMKSKVYTMGSNGPFVDGISPKVEIIEDFWEGIKNWLSLNSLQVTSVCDIPLPSESYPQSKTEETQVK